MPAGIHHYQRQLVQYMIDRFRRYMSGCEAYYTLLKRVLNRTDLMYNGICLVSCNREGLNRCRKGGGSCNSGACFKPPKLFIMAR